MEPRFAGSAARNIRRAARRGGRGCVARCGRVHVAQPEPRWRIWQLQGAALGVRPGVAESRRDVRRLDDRAFVCRMYRVLPRGARRLPGERAAKCQPECGERYWPGRYLAAPDPGDRRIVARRMGRSVHLRHPVRSQGPSCRRGARFLLDTQEAEGTWPKQDMAGVFFRTALLDYVLYRQYFPLHALGPYERRRRDRLNPAARLAAEAASVSLPGAGACGRGRRTSA